MMCFPLNPHLFTDNSLLPLKEVPESDLAEKKNSEFTSDKIITFCSSCNFVDIPNKAVLNRNNLKYTIQINPLKLEFFEKQSEEKSIFGKKKKPKLIKTIENTSTTFFIPNEGPFQIIPVTDHTHGHLPHAHLPNQDRITKFQETNVYPLGVDDIEFHIPGKKWFAIKNISHKGNSIQIVKCKPTTPRFKKPE